MAVPEELVAMDNHHREILNFLSVVNLHSSTPFIQMDFREALISLSAHVNGIYLRGLTVPF